MKRLIFLIAIVLLVLPAKSQVITLSSNQLYKSYTGVAGDTAKSTTAKTFDVFIGKGFLYYYDLEVSADSSGDGTNFTVALSGSNDGSKFYTIGSSVTWYLTSTDTVIRFNNLTSASISDAWGASTEYHDIDYPLRYEYHAIDSTGGAGFSQVDTVDIAAAVVTDTVTLAARTVTRTITEPKVGWRYLRVTFTGAGANARTEIQKITVAIRQ